MDLFKLQARIGLNTKDYEKSLSDADSKFHKFGEGLKSAAGKVGDVFAGIGKAATAGVGTASTAFGALAKSALDARADYEQLVGGVDKIFGESSKKVQEYADHAYASSGLSANEYMETVTGFSASLLQSLGGNTEMAADIANRAIIDMADNANTYGTDIASIQNAYQGFAKQNYTMLDNLKLGYGGTNEEMQRLIVDASSMNEEMQALGVTIDADDLSFGNIINSISVMQEHMKISGTTAKEAAGTVSGAISMMKASWKNFLTGTGSIKDFSDSFKTVFTNISGKMKDIVPDLTDGLKDLTKELAPEIPGVIQTLLTEFVKGGIGIIEGLKDTGKQIVSSIFPENFDDVPELVTSASNLAGTFLANLTNPENTKKLNDYAFDFVGAFLDGLTSKEALDQLTDPETGVFKIVDNVGQGLIDFADHLMDGIGGMLDNFVDYLSDQKNVDKIKKGASDAVKHFGEGLTSEQSKEALGHLLVSFCEFVGSSIAAGGGGNNAIDWENDVGGQIAWKIVKGIYSSTPFGLLSKFGSWAGEELSDLTHGMELDYLEEGSGSYSDYRQNRIDEGNSAAYNAVVHFDPSQLTGAARDAYNASRHATGFYANRPTWLSNSIVGESGDEVLLPLDTHTEWMDKLAEKLNTRTGGDIYITVNAPTGNADDIVDAIDVALRNRQLAQSRSTGGTGWK